jgi:competence protein ComEA
LIEGQSPVSDKIHINTATLEKLEQLNGIDPAKAESILRYWEEHGPFQSRRLPTFRASEKRR